MSNDLPDEDEKHVDFTANVQGKPIRFRIVAEPNKRYGDKGVDLTLRHSREDMIEAHGRDGTSESERLFALMSTLWLALRELRSLKDQHDIKGRILEQDKDRWDIDE